jgi:hypothetical protein
MYALDELFVKEARREFYDEFHRDVEDLGYSLSYGTATIDGSPGIGALVHYVRMLEGPDFLENQEKIKKVLPSVYSFRGQNIGVEVTYSSAVRVC